VFGLSIDNISLMALTLCVGFVVDDAIVMLENISRHVEMGKSVFQATLDGSREIAFTIVSMTISLAAVFIPVFFMGGILGRLLHEFAIVIIVAGNHDFAVCEKLTLEFFNSYAKSAVLWTREALTKEDLDFLQGLPITVAVDDDVTLSHATIYDAHAFDYIQTQYDAHLSLQEMRTPCGFVGHSHIPISFYLRDGVVGWTMESTIDVDACEKVLINVGSVGQPRDENPKAAYAVFDTTERKVWIKRVTYDVDAAIRAIEQNRLPRILGERLRLGK